MKEEQITEYEKIKKLERKLYLEKSKLSAEEAMEYGTTLHSLLADGVGEAEWGKVMAELINVIGMHSRGGNSVEDLRKERSR